MEKNDMKTIHELELHEELHFEDGLTVMRVSGGWIYKWTLISEQSITMTSCFVEEQFTTGVQDEI